MNFPDTIFALATPSGRSAIAIIRISGPGALRALLALTDKPVEPRKAILRVLRSPYTGQKLDQALITHFPEPQSFTGEHVAEIHCHGGMAVISGILGALAEFPGFRPAQAGEFTRRAFLNGRLDLMAAEALADLIAADTDGQRRQALALMDGQLSNMVDHWRSTLTRVMAYVEAEIDFPDEDLGLARDARNATALKTLRAELSSHLGRWEQGARIRSGFRIALVGAPNVGKSTLLNALAQRDVAIVTPQAGTTRDILEVHLNIEGYAVIVADMAGIRDSTDSVERLGVARAEAWARDADLRLYLSCVDQAPVLAELRQPRDLAVWTKADLAPAPHDQCIPISAKSGDGLDELLHSMRQTVSRALTIQDDPVFTRLRHRKALEQCLSLLDRAIAKWQSPEAELLAEDLRLASRALSELTGRIDVEEILDMVFAEFCIGK